MSQRWKRIQTQINIFPPVNALRLHVACTSLPHKNHFKCQWLIAQVQNVDSRKGIKGNNFIGASHAMAWLQQCPERIWTTNSSATPDRIQDKKLFFFLKNKEILSLKSLTSNCSVCLFSSSRLRDHPNSKINPCLPNRKLSSCRRTSNETEMHGNGNWFWSVSTHTSGNPRMFFLRLSCS